MPDTGADPVGADGPWPPIFGKVPPILDQMQPESGQNVPIGIKVPHDSGIDSVHDCFSPK